MVQAKRPRTQATAVETGESPAPPPPRPSQPHANAIALATVLLDDVPLLDSPAWSSDDELDNPTYNKRFRHKKHEEIRHRLQQRKLEGQRERQQQQQAKEQTRSSTPTQRQRQHQHPQPHPDGDGDSAAAAGGTRLSHRNVAGGESTYTASQSNTLERTKTGRSRRSRRSNATQHSIRPRGRGTSADHAVAREAQVGVAAPVVSPPASNYAADATLTLEAPAALTSAAAGGTSPGVVKKGEDDGAAAAAPTTAVVACAPSPLKAAATVSRAEHASSGSPISASRTQIPTTESSGATPSHRGTPQMVREVPPRVPLQYGKPQGAGGNANGRKSSVIAVTRSEEVVPRHPPLPTPVAFSSTEVHPPKPRTAYTPSSNFFMSKIVKGASSVTPKRSTVSPTPPAAALPCVPSREATEEALSEVSLGAGEQVVPSSEQRVSANASAPPLTGAAPSAATMGDGAESLQTALEATLPFGETKSGTEGTLTWSKDAFSAAAGVLTECIAQTVKSEQTRGNTPHKRRAMDETGVQFSAPPLSPPQSSTEPLRLSRGSAKAARSSVAPAPRPVSRVGRRSRSTSSSVVSGGAPAPDRQLRQSDYYPFPVTPSSFNFTVGGRAAAQVAAEPPHPHTGAVREASAAAAMTSTEARGGEERRSAFFGSAGHSSGIGDDYDYVAYDGEEEDEEEEDVVKGDDSASWGDLLSPTSAGSDVDYILAYHSSYYGDLLRHMETPPSRETFSVMDESVKPSETDAESPGRERGRRSAASVHFHTDTDATSVKSASKGSTRSGQSSINSPSHPGETHGAVTPPLMYSFYTHFQDQREAERAESPLLTSHVNFGNDPYALGVEDSMAALMALKKGAAEGRPPHGRQGNPRCETADCADKADLWEDYCAKRESWSSLAKPPTGPGRTQTKSSSMMSTKYSLLSSKKGLFVPKEGNISKAVASKTTTMPTTTAPPPPPPPPHGPAPVRVLSLQGPADSAATQPASPSGAVAGVKPLLLDNFGLQTVNDSKSFDLTSPMTRKTTAPPEGLAVMEEGDAKDGALPPHLMEQRQAQQPQEFPQMQQLRQQYQTLFSFAGLAVQPPPALLSNGKETNPTAAIMDRNSATTKNGQNLKKKDQAPPSSQAFSEVANATPSTTKVPMKAPIAEKKKSTCDAVGGECASGLQTASDSSPHKAEATHHALQSEARKEVAGSDAPTAAAHEDAQSRSPRDVYFPWPEAVEVKRFRSLIGSAYLTEVYTSSLRLLSSRRLPSSRPATVNTAARGGDGGDGEGHAEGRCVPTCGLQAPIPTTPQRNTVHPPLPPPATIAGVDAAIVNAPVPTSAQLKLPRLDAKPIPSTLLEESAASWATTTTTTTTTATTPTNSPANRYRRRRPISRIDALLEEAVQRGSDLTADAASSPTGPVRVAGHGSGLCWDGSTSHLSHHTDRLSAIEGGDSSRMWVAQSLPSRTIPARSGGSFLRLATAPVPPTRVQQTRGAAIGDVRRASNPNNPAPSLPLTNAAVEVPPLSVSALVRRLEAKIGDPHPSMSAMAAIHTQRPPKAQHPPTGRGLPIAQRGTAVSRSDVGADEGNSSVRPNAVASTQRPASARLHEGSSIAGMDAVQGIEEGSGAAPRGLVGFSKLSTSPLVTESTRSASPSQQAAATTRQPVLSDHNSNNVSSVNRSDEMGEDGAASAVPAPVIPLRLTREALMQQQMQQDGTILRDQHLAPSPPHLHPLDATTRQQVVPGRHTRDGAAAAASCRTTEDLLTRITVQEERRGWSGGRNFSLVSPLNAGPLVPLSIAGAPRAPHRDQRRAASAKQNVVSRINSRRTASDGSMDHAGHHRDEGSVYRPLQMVHLYSEETPSVEAKSGAAPSSF